MEPTVTRGEVRLVKALVLGLFALITIVTAFGLQPGVAHALSEVQRSLMHRFMGGVIIGREGTKIDDSFAVAPTTKDIGNIVANVCLDTELSAAATGAAVNDVCVIGLPAAPTTNISFSCFVSATDTITIRACNPTVGAINPASADYAARVFDP